MAGPDVVDGRAAHAGGMTILDTNPTYTDHATRRDTDGVWVYESYEALRRAAVLFTIGLPPERATSGGAL